MEPSSQIWHSAALICVPVFFSCSLLIHITSWNFYNSGAWPFDLIGQMSDTGPVSRPDRPWGPSVSLHMSGLGSEWGAGGGCSAGIGSQGPSAVFHAPGLGPGGLGLPPPAPHTPGLGPGGPASPPPRPPHWDCAWRSQFAGPCVLGSGSARLSPVCWDQVLDPSTPGLGLPMGSEIW